MQAIGTDSLVRGMSHPRRRSRRRGGSVDPRRGTSTEPWRVQCTCCACVCVRVCVCTVCVCTVHAVCICVCAQCVRRVHAVVRGDSGGYDVSNEAMCVCRAVNDDIVAPNHPPIHQHPLLIYPHPNMHTFTYPSDALVGAVKYDVVVLHHVHAKDAVVPAVGKDTNAV